MAWAIPEKHDFSKCYITADDVEDLNWFFKLNHIDLEITFYSTKKDMTLKDGRHVSNATVRRFCIMFN